MQTSGGAFFEKDCVCTTIDISPKPGATNGDSTAINSCRKLTPDGDFLNATGSLGFVFVSTDVYKIVNAFCEIVQTFNENVHPNTGFVLSMVP